MEYLRFMRITDATFKRNKVEQILALGVIFGESEDNSQTNVKKIKQTYMDTMSNAAFKCCQRTSRETVRYRAFVNDAV